MDTMYGAWLQQHPQIPEPQSVLHHDQRSSSAVDASWKDPSTPPAGANGAGVSAQSALDLNEFGLGDIAAVINHHVPSASTSSAPSTSPPSQSYPYQQYSYYVPGPYNATPYGSSQWNSTVPLSSYSSLNGATTSNGQSSQSPSSVQQMIIDPALTMNGSSTPSQHYNIPSNLQQRPSYQYHHNLSINPAYVQGYPQAQSLALGQQPQTLSPYVLHASPTVDSLSPSSFYSGPQPIQPPPVPQLTPQARQERFHTMIRPLLQHNQFTGAGAVHDLTDRIIALGMVEMETPLRLEILTKIRDNAGNHYFRAWVENDDAMDITREWLKAAAKGDDQLAETIMPLLHIIDRLPWSLESLRKAKLGKIILKLTKEASIPAVKDMASNLERRWRQMLSQTKDDASKKGDGEIIEDGKTKKRKLSEPPPKAGPPAKKAAVASTSSTKLTTAVVVKKEIKSSVTAVKDAKSDSSFFSAPKPKPKLPSFRKAPISIKKENDVNIAQPSSVDPFQEALKSMGKGRKETPVTVAPQTASISVSTTGSGLTKAGKKKKSVSWAPEGRLEQVKFIDRAIYDDDPVDGAFLSHNIRDLDRDEGAALHAHLFEELIDWSEPLSIDIPPDIDAPLRGGESQERIAQEEREKTTLGALYMSAAQIPDSAAEPSNQIPEDQVDSNVRLMVTGSDVDSIFWTGPPPPQTGAVNMEPASVSQLVHQLGVGSQTAMASEDPNKAFGLDPTLLSTMAGFGNVTPEQLTQILANLTGQNGFLGQQGAAVAQSMSAYGAGGGDQNWYGGEYGYDESDSRRFSSDTGWDGRGRGGGGRRGRGGRGAGVVGAGVGVGEAYKDSRKRKPCTFFAQGRCRYGDQCDFSHEPVY